MIESNFMLLIMALSLLGYTPVLFSQDYRNIALNPQDKYLPANVKPISFPHASSNSEYPGDGSDTSFWAANAIDGKTNNHGHGKNFPSWGPEKRDDLWWKVDFGESVTVDKVVIYLRADFTPYTASDHDGYWRSGTIHFSDSTSEQISFKKSAEPQIFSFSPRKTSYILIDNLKEDGEHKWCAFTEVEVWGK